MSLLIFKRLSWTVIYWLIRLLWTPTSQH